MWRLEFQARGAIHWNVLVPEKIDKQWLSETWYDIVGSGDLRHLRAGTTIQPIMDRTELKCYLCSYQKKETQKKVPENFRNVGRFWGSNKALKPVSQISLDFLSEREMHRWLRPIKKAYEKAIVRHWRRKDGKPYKFKFRSYQGFMAWGGSHLIKQIIERMGERK
jgi:hypothetical protein